MKTEPWYFPESESEPGSSTIFSALNPHSQTRRIHITIGVQRLLSGVPKVALRVRAISYLLKKGTDTRDMGWQLNLFGKVQKHAIMLEKFKAGPF